MTSSLVAGVCAGLGAAASLGLAAGAWVYASRAPGSRLFGEALTAPRRPGEIALTFDDGPNPAWTPRLLDALAAHNVQATFFLLGSFARGEPDLVRHIAAGGHLLGNHSWSHPDLSLESQKRIRAELHSTNETLAQITGAPIRFFRPPFGARRPAVFRIARELGLQTVLWNAMTSDWREPSAERITARLAQKTGRLTQSGQAVNIVLHDGGHRAQGTNRGPSIAAASALLTQYAATLRFVRLDSWQ
jgi:peptidoglycan/xylan/chitin deacetylase (PgdA/CDA1 family)